MQQNQIRIVSTKIPKHNVEVLASRVYDACKKFYEDPENMRKFEEWKKERDSKVNN